MFSNRIRCSNSPSWYFSHTSFHFLFHTFKSRKRLHLGFSFGIKMSHDPENQNSSISPDVLAIRNSVNRNTEAASSFLPWPVGMQESSHEATSHDGSVLEVRRFVPKVVATQPTDVLPNRAVVYVFGGGFVGGGVSVFRGFMATFAELSDTQVFAPQWRTAPEHPYPAGVNDVYATIKWLQDNAADFNVDPARIVIVGQSAGGTLAAGVSLLARDRGLEPPIAAQVLRYPAFDDQTELDTSKVPPELLWWTQAQNDTVWKAYMGGLDKGGLIASKHLTRTDIINCCIGERNDSNTPGYAAPARARDLRSLPPAHLGVGEHDLLRNEIEVYAKRLQEAGVKTEIFVYSESRHGFDGVPGSVQGKIMWDREADFVKNV